MALTIQNIGILIMLILGSIWDIREKKIPVILLIAEAFTGGLLVLSDTAIHWNRDWYVYAVGVFIGIILLLMSRFCNGCIGVADGIITAIIGGITGYRDTLLLLMYAIFSAALFSIVLIGFRKAGRKTTIPFLPFMLLGYVFVIIENGVTK